MAIYGEVNENVYSVSSDESYFSLGKLSKIEKLFHEKMSSNAHLHSLKSVTPG